MNDKCEAHSLPLSESCWWVAEAHSFALASGAANFQCIVRYQVLHVVYMEPTQAVLAASSLVKSSIMMIRACARA
eukprot:COSAG06_NODE_4575_length_4131_cov_3.121280_2_plen_75_part_00